MIFFALVGAAVIVVLLGAAAMSLFLRRPDETDTHPGVRPDIAESVEGTPPL